MEGGPKERPCIMAGVFQEYGERRHANVTKSGTQDNGPYRRLSAKGANTRLPRREHGVVTPHWAAPGKTTRDSPPAHPSDAKKTACF